PPTGDEELGNAYSGSWQRRCGYHQRLLSGSAGLSGDGDRPSAGGRGRDQSCQCRTDFTRLCLALGCARGAAESHQVDAAEACAAVDPAHCRHQPVPVHGAHAAQLHRCPLRGEQGAHVRLSEYSRDCLDELRVETGLTYEDRQRGTTQLFRTQAQLEGAAKDIKVLEQMGVPYELLDSKSLASAEPGLAKVAHKLTGGLRLPNDQTGDCLLFTQRIAQMARDLGVEFRFNQNIERLDYAGDR